MLLGDNSDKVAGVKGLGAKGLFKKFPELKTHDLTLDDIFDISARKFKDHVVYSRIIQEQTRIETNYKVMDLSVPMIDDRGKEHIDNLIIEDKYQKKRIYVVYLEKITDGCFRTLTNSSNSIRTVASPCCSIGLTNKTVPSSAISLVAISLSSFSVPLTYL